MKIALLTKNKLGFVDGTCKKEYLQSTLHSQWERCNAIIFSWILNIVSQELSARIVFISSVALVWKDLQERFDNVDGSYVFFLHREITSHNQGTSSILVYFTRLKLM